MNLTETSNLLTFIARCDNRRVDDATAIAWQSLLSDLPITDCLAAARQHFQTSDAYLMPVHIRRLAAEIDRERRRVERERREESERLAIEADPTRRDRSAEVRALIATLRDSLPDGDPDKLHRPEVVEWERQRERAARAEPNPLYDPTVHAQLAEETP